MQQLNYDNTCTPVYYDLLLTQDTRPEIALRGYYQLPMSTAINYGFLIQTPEVWRWEGDYVQPTHAYFMSSHSVQVACRAQELNTIIK